MGGLGISLLCKGTGGAPQSYALQVATTCGPKVSQGQAPFFVHCILGTKKAGNGKRQIWLLTLTKASYALSFTGQPLAMPVVNLSPLQQAGVRNVLGCRCAGGCVLSSCEALFCWMKKKQGDFPATNKSHLAIFLFTSRGLGCPCPSTSAQRSGRCTRAT